MGCHLWGHTESDTTEVTQQQQQQQQQQQHIDPSRVCNILYKEHLMRIPNQKSFRLHFREWTALLLLLLLNRFSHV